MTTYLIKRLSFFMLAVSCCLLAQPSQPSQPVHPATEIFAAPISDPLYGFNHAMESFNSGCVQYVIYPISCGYNAIVPDCVSKALSNCGNNLLYPLHFVNCSLQGHFSHAWEETQRFAVNTTAGILGLRDQASAWGLKKHHEDFGQTFATWGIGPGCYLNLPFAGPTNVRDGIGSFFGIPFNIAFWLTGANAVFITNGTLLKADFINEYFTTSIDTYPMTRLATVIRREALTADSANAHVTSNPNDSLGYLQLMLKDKSFRRKSRNYSVQLPGADRKLVYTFWKRPDFNGQILFFLPGIGSHRNDSRVAALACLAYNAGWSVAVISSTFTPDFFLATPNRLPGIVKKDVDALDKTLVTIQQDILQRETLHDLPPLKYAVMGVSLGAINTLNLAARDHAGTAEFHAERYIAINPPRNPIFALQQLDSFFDIPLSWPAETRKQHLHDLAMRIAALLETDDTSGPASEIPKITYEESLFLIGLNLRSTLLNIAQSIRALPASPAIWPEQQDDTIPRNTRDANAFSCSFKTYIQDILLPYAYAAKQISASQDLPELAKDYTLDALASHLQTNAKVVLFHNENDPLLDKGDITWFSQLFGHRAVIFPRGGHLGNLAIPQVQNAIIQALP